MKNRRLYAILLALLICALVALACLWTAEKQDHSELEDLCSYCAYRAYERFSRYREEGHLYDYAYGVAELESFLNSYMNLVILETGSTDTNVSYLNQLIGVLMDYPELTDGQKDMLVTISHQLNQNIRDLNVYDDIFYLYNQLAC